ncbi:hypothetical protein EIN_475820 [Entamoeba invadens IP1]|uniref:Small-subunit processome Utp12 domain-containing protein n=1 Tax=Entamoeba invadens IP1 TaxID=370355 RepID=A0A0A1U9S7_ENTIV|nr:hypothetical protein EIN_475820 [Entamoeba invadens IP1]ELP88880.1 hypothetical protein EIN_475820 [Entamoeba invadens IP1]|eukprot:XP_004255651.1 hypothetical protein EIN_475820 [Entamoeba invadens IP1]
MVKTYLDYKVESRSGSISTANVVYFDLNQILLVRNNRVDLVNTRTNRVEKSFQCDEEVSVVSVDSDRHNIAVGSVKGKIFLFSIEDSELLVTLSGHRTPVQILEFSPKGTILVSIGLEPEIVVWDVIKEEGICRLRGHLNVIRAAVVYDDIVITAGDDGLVKVWDLEVQQCKQTLVGHQSAIKSLKEIEPGILMTGSLDGKIRVLKLEEGSEEVLTLLGEGNLNVTGYVTSIQVHKTFCGLSVYGGTLVVGEIITTEDRKKSKKRRKRVENNEFVLSDYLVVRHGMKVNETIKSLSVFTHKGNAEAKVIVGDVNGYLEYQYKKFEPELIQEHKRPDSKIVLVSDDDVTIASIGDGNCEIWTINGKSCSSVRCGRANVATFLPGGRFVAIGTLGGSIEIVDTSAAVVIGSIKGHDSEVTALKMWKVNDFLGIVTAGKDKKVRVWELNVSTDEDGGKCVEITLKNEYDMDDSVISLELSKKVLIVGTNDNNVKVYKLPEMQFYLSLYGHNLPVTSISISDDDELVITGSADKTVKIWGLQFGECKRTMKVHDDIVTGVVCIPRTHYFMSVSRDKKMRYFDADKMILIKTYDTHEGGIMDIVCSKYGDYVVTTSLDHSFIVWMRGKEQVFVEEEERKLLTTRFDEEELKEIDFVDRNAPERLETTDATKKTVEMIRSAEDLMSVIDTVTQEMNNIEGYTEEYKKWEVTKEGEPPVKPEPSIALMGTNPNDYLMNLVMKIQAANLHQILLMLPTSHAVLLLGWVNTWLAENKRVLTCVNIASFLCKVHYSYLVGSKDQKITQILESLSKRSQEKIETLRITTATNLELLTVVDLKLNTM